MPGGRPALPCCRGARRFSRGGERGRGPASRSGRWGYVEGTLSLTVPPRQIVGDDKLRSGCGVRIEPALASFTRQTCPVAFDRIRVGHTALFGPAGSLCNNIALLNRPQPFCTGGLATCPGPKSSPHNKNKQSTCTPVPEHFTVYVYSVVQHIRR